MDALRPLPMGDYASDTLIICGFSPEGASSSTPITCVALWILMRSLSTARMLV